MRVLIFTAPHRNQRYETPGDWYAVKAFGSMPAQEHVVVSELGDRDSELLVALHELFEMHLCKRDGISQQQVDDWDIGNESHEPGAEPGCPYGRQHELAERLERFAADLLGVDWGEHERRVHALAK